MYYTRRDLNDTRNVWSEHVPQLKQKQKDLVNRRKTNER